jgi:hypothetical protein
MSHPRDWSPKTYFLIGLSLGILMACGVLTFVELSLWAQIAIAVLLPVWMGLLAAGIREDIFFWIVP